MKGNFFKTLMHPLLTWIFRLQLTFLKVLLLACGLTGQNEYLTFEHFTHEQGLSAPVTLIAQDHFGFLWLGTRDGLNRFDGRNFIVYRNIPGDSKSIANNIINFIFVDSKGRVWTATNGGLCYYDYADDAFHQIEYDETLEELDRHRVHAVAEGKDNSIWFATRTLLHQWKEGHPIKTFHLNGSKDFLVKFLLIDGKDRKWVGSHDGITVFYEENNSKLKGVVQSEFTRENNLTATVHPMVMFRDDTLLTGSWYGGLQKCFIDRDTVICISYMDLTQKDLRRHIVSGLAKGNDDIWWIGTYGAGLSWWDSRTKQFIQHFHNDPSDAKSLGDDYVNDVFRDASGIIWVGTGKGLDKFDPLTQQFKSIPIPVSPYQFSVYRLANTIVEDSDHNNILWMCISGAGLHKFDRNTGTFSLYRHDDKSSAQLINNFYSFYQDHKGRVWVGTRVGLFYFNKQTGKFSKTPLIGENDLPGVHTILQNKQGIFWMATHNNGFYRYNEEKNELTTYTYDENNPNTLRDNRVFCMILDKEGKIWVGTQNRGMSRLDPVSGDFLFFEHDKKNPATLPDNGVYDLYEDGKQNLWIGTESGFSKMNLNNFTFKNYYTPDGLCNNSVFTITPDNSGNLWLGTNNGLSVFDPDIDRFRNYYTNDGLPINRIDGEVMYTSDHTLCFGTPGMISFCQPEMMKVNTLAPRVIITDYSILGKSVPVMREKEMLTPIHLSHKENMITFNFAALSFTNSFLNQYAYKLEGFDDDWRYAGNQQSATYTNLNGGEYTFRVKASNNDGTWNQDGTHVLLFVHPPFWKTWWFYLLCTMAVAGVLYAYYRIRINQLMRLQSIRSRIARDLHDDIGSTLSSINMISSMADKQKTNETRSAELFHTISSASGQAMDLMSDIVWSINPKNDKLEMIIIRMRQYASEILEAAGIEFSMDIDQADKNIQLPLEIRKDFYLVFKEAINNLAKYSKATKASIRLKILHHTIHLQIEDNGIGIDPQRMHAGNGLRNMKSRADHMEGHLELHSQAGQGTRIELSVPLSP